MKIQTKNRPRLADLMAEMAGNPPLLPGWDEMQELGLEVVENHEQMQTAADEEDS